MAKEKTELIEDFSDGLATYIAPNRISPKATPTCADVWYQNGALTKRNGSFVAYALASGARWFGISSWQYTITGQSSYSLLVQANINTSEAGTWLNNPMLTGTTTAALGYAFLKQSVAGTVSVSAGSPTITGVGTSFDTTANVGDLVRIGVTAWLQVLTVDSATQITATANASGALSGQTYVIAPAWPSTNVVSMVSMNSKLWVSGRGAKSMSFDGTNTVRIAAFPEAPYSLIYKNYVFAGGTLANPSRLSWSALKDPTSWPGSNFVDVNPDDGYPIVGLFYDGQSLVILKSSSAYKLTGDIFDPSNPSYTLTQIYTPSDFKCGTARAVQLFQGRYVILGNVAFYSYSGGSSFEKIPESDGIKDDIAAIQGSVVVTSALSRTEPKSIVYAGNYLLAVQSSLYSSNGQHKNAVYVWDKSGRFWRFNPGLAGRVSDFAYFDSTLTGVNSDPSQAATMHGIMTLDTGTSDINTTAIAGTWTSKVFEFTEKQRFGLAYVFYKKQAAGNLTFEYSVDEGAFSSVTIDMTGGTGTRVKSAPIIIGQQGKTIQFRFSNSTAAQTFEIYAIQFNRIPLRQ